MTHPPGDSPPDPSADPGSRRTGRAGSPRRLNAAVVALLCVIITGAFAFSAETWIGLAESVGFRTRTNAGDVTLRLSWVLPIAVDGYLCLTTWLFLTARPRSTLRRYAGWSLLVAVVLSVVAQGIYHGLDARGTDVAQVWGLVVVVGGLPPALLASSVHLLSVYLHDRHEPTAARPRPSRPTPRAVEAKQPAKPKRQGQRLAVVGRSNGPGVSDAQIADAVTEHVRAQRRIGQPPVQREMVRLVESRTGVKVGQRRCVRVAESITGDRSGDDQEDASWAA